MIHSYEEKIHSELSPKWFNFFKIIFVNKSLLYYSFIFISKFEPNKKYNHKNHLANSFEQTKNQTKNRYI